MNIRVTACILTAFIPIISFTMEPQMCLKDWRTDDPSLDTIKSLLLIPNHRKEEEAIAPLAGKPAEAVESAAPAPAYEEESADISAPQPATTDAAPIQKINLDDWHIFDAPQEEAVAPADVPLPEDHAEDFAAEAIREENAAPANAQLTDEPTEDVKAVANAAAPQLASAQAATAPKIPRRPAGPPRRRASGNPRYPKLKILEADPQAPFYKRWYNKVMGSGYNFSHTTGSLTRGYTKVEYALSQFRRILELHNKVQSSCKHQKIIFTSLGALGGGITSFLRNKPLIMRSRLKRALGIGALVGACSYGITWLAQAYNKTKLARTITTGVKDIGRHLSAAEQTETLRQFDANEEFQPLHAKGHWLNKRHELSIGATPSHFSRFLLRGSSHSAEAIRSLPNR